MFNFVTHLQNKQKNKSFVTLSSQKLLKKKKKSSQHLLTNQNEGFSSAAVCVHASRFHVTHTAVVIAF